VNFSHSELGQPGHDPLSTTASGSIPTVSAENVVAGHIILYGAGGLGGRSRRFLAVGGDTN